MMAAVFSAEKGNQTVLLEKNEKLGKKIYITGKDAVISRTTAERGSLLKTWYPIRNSFWEQSTPFLRRKRRNFLKTADFG